MKRLIRGILVGLLVLLFTVVMVYAVSYYLNRDVPATITVDDDGDDDRINVELYTDALCQHPLPPRYQHDFGSVGTVSYLYFESEKIDPATVEVEYVGAPSGMVGSYTVGTPTAEEGFPCPIGLKVENVGAGTYNFTLHITGE